MRNYEVQSITQPSIKDAFVTRSRQQAFDIFLGKLLKYLTLIIAIEILCYVITGKFINFIIALPSVLLALFDYAKALVYFTTEDRDYLFNQQSIIEVESNNALAIEDKPKGNTIIPQASGKSIYVLSTSLSESQKKAIADTMLNTGTLTVNYLESLGLSRQSSEGLRAELAQLDILEFDNKGRVSLTNKGEKICKRITKEKD